MIQLLPLPHNASPSHVTYNWICWCSWDNILNAFHAWTNDATWCSILPQPNRGQDLSMCLYSILNLRFHTTSCLSFSSTPSKSFNPYCNFTNYACKIPFENEDLFSPLVFHVLFFKNTYLIELSHGPPTFEVHSYNHLWSKLVQGPVFGCVKGCLGNVLFRNKCMLIRF